MPFLTQCPKCGSKNSVEINRVTTAVYCQPFTDDQGNRHFHDSNMTTIGLICDKCKHIFDTKEYNRCWCGWTNDPAAREQEKKPVTDKPQGKWKPTPKERKYLELMMSICLASIMEDVVSKEHAIDSIQKTLNGLKDT
jgi:hypothetical protein